MAWNSRMALSMGCGLPENTAPVGLSSWKQMAPRWLPIRCDRDAVPVRPEPRPMTIMLVPLYCSIVDSPLQGQIGRVQPPFDIERAGGGLAGVESGLFEAFLSGQQR